jgi:hypothetical protein
MPTKEDKMTKSDLKDLIDSLMHCPTIDMATTLLSTHCKSDLITIALAVDLSAPKKGTRGHLVSRIVGCTTQTALNSRAIRGK